jgi:hypothetical protein
MPNYLTFLVTLPHVSALTISVSHIFEHEYTYKLVCVTDVKYSSYLQGLTKGLSDNVSMKYYESPTISVTSYGNL